VLDLHINVDVDIHVDLDVNIDLHILVNPDVEFEHRAALPDRR